MSQIRIEVIGVSYAEAVDLSQSLREIEGVETTRVPWRTQDHAINPDAIGFIVPEIRASIEAFSIVITVAFMKSFAEGLGKKVGEKAGEDAYKAIVKDRLLPKLSDWLASKQPERRERITLKFDDDQKLIYKGKD
jgi:hypothetical protein